MDPTSRDDAVVATASFARELSTSASEPQQLELAVATVVALVEGCDHAGVTMVTRDGLETMSATSELVKDSDQLQYELGEGPCLDTVKTHMTVISNEIGSDPRWPRSICTPAVRTPTPVRTSSLPTASLRTWPWPLRPLARSTIAALPWFPVS